MIILALITIIFLIFLEITLSAFFILKLKEVEKKLIRLDRKIRFYSKIIILACRKIRSIAEKTNKFVQIITSKKMIRIQKIIKFTFSIIQIILLFKSLKISKNFSLKDLKKLLYVEISKNLIWRFLKFTCR